MSFSSNRHTLAGLSSIRIFSPIDLYFKRFTWLSAVVATIVYILLTAAITWNFLPSLGITLYNWGDALQQTWTLGWNAQQFLHNPLKLYEAPIFYPYPHSLAFSDTLVPQSALALPLILFTNNLVLAHNLGVFATFVLNGLGMFLLLRAWKLNFWGALIGGTVFSFGSYHIAHFGHLNLLSTEWMPFTLLFFDRASKTPRVKYFFLFGLFFFLSATSSFYFAFMTLILVLVYGCVVLAQDRSRWSRTVWARLTITTVVVFLLIVPFGFPYIELAQSFGLQRTLQEMQDLSAIPSSYLASVTKHPPVAWLKDLFPPIHGEAQLSPGILAWSLAFFGILQWKRWKPTLALLAIGITGFVLSLGPEQNFGDIAVTMPYRWLYEWTPGFDGAMRALARWGVLVLFATAALAGFGFHQLTLMRGQRRVALAAIIAMLAVGWLYLEYDKSPVRLMTGTLIREPVPPVYTWLKTQPDGAVLELPIGDDGIGRARDVWYQYYSLIHRHRIVNGSLAIAPRTYAEVMERADHFPSADAIDLVRALDIRYVILHSPADADTGNLQARVSLFKNSLRQVNQFGNDHVFEVLPRPPAANSDIRLEVEASLPPDSTARAHIVADPSPAQHQLFSERGLVDIATQWQRNDGTLLQGESVRERAPLLRDENGVVIPFETKTPSQTGIYQFVIVVNGLSAPVKLEQTVEIKVPVADLRTPAIQLIDAFVGRRAARSGEWLKLRAHWKVIGKVESDYVFFAHLVDSQGRTRAELNAEALASSWQAGQTRIEEYSVPIPFGLPQDTYTVLVGLAQPQTSQPIEIRGPDGSIETALTLDMPAYVGKGWGAKPLTPMYPSTVDFGNWVRFAGYDLESDSFMPGETMPLTLYWIARERTDQSNTVFVHLVHASGKIVAQNDSPPLKGRYPTFAWNDGEWIRDPYPVALPDNLSPGKYTLEIGWYNSISGERTLANVGKLPVDHLDIAIINVLDE